MKRIAPMDAFAESSSGAGTAEAAYPSLAQRPRLLLPTPTLARLPSRGLNRGDPVPSIPMGLPSVAGITSLFGQSSSSATGTRPFEEELAGFVPRTAIAPAASTPQWRQPEYYRELMALLDEYQDGVPTHQLQAKFPGQISRYLSDTGQIMSKGWEFRTALRNADKSRFDQAVDRRLELWKLSQPHSKAKLGTESPITEFYCTYERIFSRLELILDAYATGATMQGLQKSCAPVNLKSYLTNNGLSKVAGDFLLALLDRDQQAKLLKAIEDRQAIQRIASRFVAATRAFADPSRPMERVARKVKVDVADLRRFLTETGLTERGRAYVSACDAPTRQLIEANLALRRDAVRTATEGRAFAELDRRLGPGNASRTEPEDAGSRLGLTEDVDIKQEIPAPAGPSTRTVLVEREIDQARTAFHEELAEICDLTEDLPQWSSKLAEHGAVIVHHRMRPMLANDDKFPLRDPADPLGRAHPRYVGDDGKCHPNVQLTKISMCGKQEYEYLKTLCDHDPRLRLDHSQLRQAMQALTNDAEREFKRLIREERSDAPRCLPRELQVGDVQDHEQVLIGQYGLFARRPEDPADTPTLSNGRILGFYMGALHDSNRQREQAKAIHPDLEHYAVDAWRRPRKQRGRARWSSGRRETLVTYSGLGSTNSVAFANTALRPSAPGNPDPVYDRERLNAIFLPFHLELKDKNGMPRNEVAVALVALDNLFDVDDNSSEAQVFADYGDAYLENFLDMRAPPTVKREV